MFRKLIGIALCGALLSATAIAAGWETLPLSLESAKAQVQSPPDKAADLQAAGELLRLTRLFPTSSIVPDALWIAAQLEQRSGLTHEATDLATQVVQTYPTTEAAQPAFEFVVTQLEGDGQLGTAALLARTTAVGLGAQPQAGRYYLLAFHAYRRANMWREGTDVALLRLNNVSALPEPKTLLDMADVALLAGNTAAAQQFLQDVIEHSPSSPEIVSAYCRLGGISSSQGNDAQATDHYARAWATFQKCRKNASTLEESVTHDAAQALWELQTPTRLELDNLTALDRPLQLKNMRRTLEALEEAYTQIRDTDPQSVPRALYALGEIHTQVADALLKDGFVRATNSGDVETPAYAAALPEYDRAAAFFADAYHKSPSGVNENFCRKAAEHAFETTMGKGDAVFAWSLELLRRTPLTATGELSDQSRFAYLSTRVAPVAQEALTHRLQALNLAADLHVASEAGDLQQTLDLPLRPLTKELAALCEKQNQRATDASAQLAKSFAFGLGLTSITPLAATMETQFAQVTEFQTRYHDLLGTVYVRLQAGKAETHTLAVWDSMLASAYFDYSNLCRRVEDDMAVCAANLAPQQDETAQSLRKRVTKVLNQSSQDERTALADWHDLAARYGIHQPLGKNLEARLAELDPARYPRTDDTPSADRKPK
jgi:TolA-binding protein